MDYIYAPPTVKVEFELAPALNAFESLSLLASTHDLSGLSPWVEQTYAVMPPEQRSTLEMLMNTGLWAVRPKANQTDFASYINELASQNAIQLRNKVAGWSLEECQIEVPEGEPLSDSELAAVIQDVNAYMEYIDTYYRTKKAEKGHVIDFEPFKQIHRWFSDPEGLKNLIVTHFRMMWEMYLKPEWERKLPLLRESLEAFRQMEYRNLTGIEAVRAVTGRDVTSIGWNWELPRLVFVPQLHIGPYINMAIFDEDKSTGWLMFGVRLPEGSRMRSPELSRSELNVRLSALADDTRLRILELVVEQGELCAQDIITMLDLSQSAASRNLRQLTATGYLIERRRETAKCYSINHDRVEDTLRAVRRFLNKR